MDAASIDDSEVRDRSTLSRTGAWFMAQMQRETEIVKCYIFKIGTRPLLNLTEHTDGEDISGSLTYHQPMKW